MLADFLTPFFAVGLAEFGDKTQLSILLLSSRTRNHFKLLVGVILAFFVVDGVAVLAGYWVSDIISPTTLTTVSAVVFIIFGLLIIRSDVGESDSRLYSRSPLLSGFLLIFFTEWGDKTQILAALFAAKYSPVLVLAGTVASMALLSAAAVYVGKRLSDKIDKKKISKLAGFVFILLGVMSLLL